MDWNGTQDLLKWKMKPTGALSKEGGSQEK